VESRDRVALSSRRRAEELLEAKLEVGMLGFSKDPAETVGGEKVVDHVSTEASLLAQAVLFAPSPLPPSVSGCADAYSYAASVRKWAKRRLRGGVPSALAIKNGVNSRHRLLRRARSNRDLWHVVPMFWVPDDL
jgi:hypothetical protein